MQIDVVSSEKTRLRSKFLGIRDSLVGEAKVKSDRLISKNLFLSYEYRWADSILTYVSKGSESDTLCIIEHAFNDNKSIAVPKCVSNCEMEFYYIKSIEDLEPGSFGVLEPKDGLEKVQSIYGICLVPGICFDKMGIRLGYGKGYYDRFLPNFQGTAIGLCKDDFFVDRLPRDSTDYRVNMVITDKGVYITD